ncbi:hypothetical protein Q3G72_008708 [Acer saccharum]|nr:hypothetical protein Q3G72_008708 [Acer saccharum]
MPTQQPNLQPSDIVCVESSPVPSYCNTDNEAHTETDWAPTDIDGAYSDCSNGDQSDDLDGVHSDGSDGLFDINGSGVNEEKVVGSTSNAHSTNNIAKKNQDMSEELPGVDSNTVQFKSDGEIASQSSENDIDMSSTSDDDSDSDADTNGLVDMDEPKLKTMKVSNCSLLIDLPPRLQTLTIDGCVDLRMLEFLSPKREIFKKSFLEYLCIESSCDSLRFLPLDLFPKLRTLNLWNCANFNSIFIAKNRKSLEKLQIRDCPKLLSFPEGGLRTPNLTTIVLSNCKNLKALPDHLHKLTTLLRLDIKECPELESIPEGGLPCNLHFIRIRSCEKLTPLIEWGMLKLQNLDYFEIEGGCKDLESFPEQNLLPSSIIKLRISKLQKLEFLDYMGIKQLRSLETLMISSCKWLRYLPHHGLSSSLISLYINDCPLLKSDFKNNIVEKKKWFGVDHIPHVQIDTEVIS